MMTYPIIKTVTVEELLLRVELDPIRMKHGKGTRLALLNQIFTMNHWRRKALHDDMIQSYCKAIKAVFSDRGYSFPHMKESVYRVSVGYMRGKNTYDDKKTKTLDCDGLAFLSKVATDALIKSSSIPDDSIFHLDQQRQKYLGDSTDGYEHLIMQVTKLISEEILWEKK